VIRRRIAAALAVAGLLAVVASIPAAIMAQPFLAIGFATSGFVSCCLAELVSPLE
jgi:hypothetical protein